MIQSKLKILIVFLTAAGLIGCGGEDAQTVDCADGTYFDEDSGECIADETQCEDNERFVEEFNACARINDDFCADDTEFVDGSCVANADLECGEDTAAEDGECVVSTTRECGEGTVVFDGQCVPDDICDDGTADISDDDEPTFCRPINESCGEGTVFDVATRTCIRSSQVECGLGTTAEGGTCIPTSSFFSDLADNPDLDMSVDGTSGNFVLADTGELFTFVGTISSPEMVDDEWVQDEDVYSFDADAGQWLRISVYSLGLPEPGFWLTGDDDFYRLSDLGSGIEVTREILIPADGSYEFSVSNMPQMLSNLPPAGGDDWDYVGYVETMDSPDAEPVDIFSDTISGDIRDLTNNFYAVDDMDDVDDVQMLFGSIPEDADGEVQVWSDATTLVETLPLESLSLSIVPPSDSFYLVFDRAHAFGASTAYSFSAVEAEPLADGESITEDVALDAGDYLGVFQYNTADETLSATISGDDDTVLNSTNELVVSIAAEGQNSLYYFADEATTVTVDIENITDQDLDSVSYQLITGSSDVVDIDDGDPQQHDYDGSLMRGQRHYYQLDVDYDDLLAIEIQDAAADALLSLDDENGELVLANRNVIIFEASPQDYLLYVEAEGGIGNGFTLDIEETDIFEVDETSSPGLIIPRGGSVTDTIDVANCPNITEIEIYVEIIHWWRGDLIVDITAPDGSSTRIHNTSGGSTNDIIGTYPNPSDSGLESGTGLLDYVDTSGAGSWEIRVEDTYSFGSNTSDALESWGVHLVCGG